MSTVMAGIHYEILSNASRKYVTSPVVVHPRARTQAQLLIGAFVFLAATFLAVGADRLVEFAYPVGAVIVAAILFRISRSHFLSFAFWLWWLSPELRRIVDFHLGWNWQNPIILAPYLATMVSVLGLRIRSYRVPPWPFLLIFSGISFGYIVGLVFVGFAPATFAAINWLAPPVCCCSIAADVKEYLRYRSIVVRTFLWGGLVMGIYGVVQFFFLPSWDAYWMIHAGMGSQGLPTPGLVRVFGTMSSSGPYASTMVTCLLIGLASRSRVHWPASAAALAGLLLSLVRTSWIAFGIGWIYMVSRLRLATKIKFIIVACLAAMCLPLLAFEPMSTIVGKRFDTLSSLEEDASYQDRSEFFNDIESQLSLEGIGLGATGLSTKLGSGGTLGQYGDFDSGLLEIPFTLGLMGGLLYGAGVVWLVCASVWQRREANGEHDWIVTCEAVVLGALSTIVSGNSLIGSNGGLIFWSFLGLLLAGKSLGLNPEKTVVRRVGETPGAANCAHFARGR